MEVAKPMTTNRPPLPGDIRDNLQKIGDTVDAMILGGPRKYIADVVLSRAGIDRERAEHIWRAMGFATPPFPVIRSTARMRAPEG